LKSKNLNLPASDQPANDLPAKEIELQNSQIYYRTQNQKLENLFTKKYNKDSISAKILQLLYTEVKQSKLISLAECLEKD
jgi:hypothetical protein